MHRVPTAFLGIDSALLTRVVESLQHKGRDQDEYAFAETHRERSTPVKAARVEQRRMALRAASRTQWGIWNDEWGIHRFHIRNSTLHVTSKQAGPRPRYPAERMMVRV
jgi:hypothetical protein